MASTKLVLSLVILSVSLQNVAATPCVASGLDAFADLAGSTCATYNDQLQDGSVAFCAGIVDYPYFKPPNTLQEELEGKVAQQLVGNDPTGGALFGLLPPRCTVAIKQAACTAVFQRCELVDDFFLDSCASCSKANQCTRDGLTFATCQDAGLPNGVICGTDPGGPLGALQGNGDPLTWAQFLQLGPGNVSNQEKCANLGLTYVPGNQASGDACMRAIPRSPCKSGCDILHDNSDTVVQVPGLGPQLEAVCPLISGYFYPLLRAIFDNPDGVDPYVYQSVSSTLAGKSNCDATPIGASAEATCTSLKFNVNMFSTVFGAFPSCSATLNTPPKPIDFYAYGQTYTLESYVPNNPRAPSLSIGALMELKANSLGTSCSIPDTAPGFTCDDYKNKAKCFKASEEVPAVQPQQTIAFSSPSGYTDTCSGWTSDANGAQLVQTEFESIFGPGLGDSARLGLRFVAPALGMPALVTTPLAAPGFREQPNIDDKTPLCSFRVRTNGESDQVSKIVQGTNAHECAHLRMENVIQQLPPWVSLDCQLAVQQLSCRSNELKVEKRSLCLLFANEDCANSDVEGAATSSIPFQFVLPRFPSKLICENVQSKCSSFLSFLETTDPIGYAQFNTALDCDQRVGFNCEAENTIWNSKVWPCTTPFDGLEAFPTSRQTFLSVEALSPELADLVEKYLKGTKKSNEYLSEVFSTETVPLSTRDLVAESVNGNDTFLTGICQCPYPLQVPENPLSGGISDFVCCDQPCLGTTFTDDEVVTLYILMLVTALVSLVGAGFVACTWGTFRSKRKQSLTLYFAVASSCLAVIIIISGIRNLQFANSTDEPTAAKHPSLCKSNTEVARALENPACALEAVGIYFFGLVASCFWFCQSLDLYLRLVRKMSKIDFRRYYVAYSLTFPFISTVILFANDKFGFTSPLPWCFIVEDAEPFWDFVFFYGPIFTMLVAGFVMVVLAIRVMLQHHKSATVLGEQHMKKMQHVYYTTAVFVATFTLIWAFIFAFRVDLEAKRQGITDGAVLWASCLLSNFANGITNPATDPNADNSILSEYRDPGTGCGFVLPVTLELTTFRIFITVTVGQGFFMFLIFGVRRANFKLWAHRFASIAGPMGDSTMGVSNTGAYKDGSSYTPGPYAKAGSSIINTSQNNWTNENSDNSYTGYPSPVAVQNYEQISYDRRRKAKDTIDAVI